MIPSTTLETNINYKQCTLHHWVHGSKSAYKTLEQLVHSLRPELHTATTKFSLKVKPTNIRTVSMLHSSTRNQNSNIWS